MSRQAIGRVLTILFVAAIAMAEPTSAANTPARGLTLLGSVQLGGPASISRLSTLGSTAFVGNHTLGCPLSGVHIVDFTEPSAPV